MKEIRDSSTQTDIPYLSIMNSVVWNQHLNQMKFDLKQIVLLSDTFNSTISGSSDKIFYDIFHAIEHSKSEDIYEILKEKLDEINKKYSGFKTALMTLLRNYFTNRTAMFNDLDKTNSLFLKNFRSKSVDSDEVEMIISGERIKRDMRMIINVINFFEFDYNDDMAEHFHDILSFALKTCKERSNLLSNDTGAFSQILVTIKEGVRFSGVTNYTGDAALEQTESDRSLQKLSFDTIDAHSEIINYNSSEGLTEVERDLIIVLKKRSEDMINISKSMERLREIMKQNISV